MFEKHNNKQRKHKQATQPSRALSVGLIQNEEPDRSYYITSTLENIGHFLFSQTQELYKALSLVFSADSLDWRNFKRYAWPIATSGIALVFGELLTRGMSQYQTDSENYDFVYKFILGAAILSCSSLNRITDRHFKSTAAFSAAVASEVVGIVYMYYSVFTGTQRLTSEQFSEDYSLIASIATSTLFVPAGASFLTQKVQKQLLKWQHNLGAQRSDTATIPSGLTPVGNLYFQLGHIMARELMPIPRLFQLGLIAENIRQGEGALRQFRNAPALIADLTPATIRESLAQQAMIQDDYEYNHKEYQVLKFTPQGAHFITVLGYLLRTGDLVFCNEAVDLASVKISGELIALKQGEQGQFLEELEQQKFSVNLKAQNGEDVWIEHRSKTAWDSPHKTVCLRLVRDGKQAGVMVGDKLNVFGAKNFFIQIKPADEFLSNNDIRKAAVINQIIGDRKRKSVYHSLMASAALAVCTQSDLRLLPAEISKYTFNVFQAMIPFSEQFLREMVNGQLLKRLNKNLGDRPLETIDALRIVDLCHALSGYTLDRFPQGVAIISDKTGTLTTNGMNVLGLWTTAMSAQIQSLVKKKDPSLLPSGTQLAEVFELFCQAYTNNLKEMEPEEDAILQLLNSLLKQKSNLQVAVLGNNHFRKNIFLNEHEKEIETFHLGLYRNFGGRLTLVRDGVSHHLVFCGIPKTTAFNNTRLLRDYYSMNTRMGVLSRDWCIARAELNEKQFKQLQAYFDQDNKKDIESFLMDNPQLLENMQHHGTFIIDNPVKKGAEQFISSCRSIQVPVFVATGDTTKAAENIANVLCSEYAKTINILRAEHLQNDNILLDEEHIPAESTVIFSGINSAVLTAFQKLLARDKSAHPVIIFAEMSTEGKGILARFLKDNQFFIIANGDGSNDVLMMKEAHTVIAHCSEDNSLAPGVGSFADLTDVQLRRLLSSDKSFYELFDIADPHSIFIQLFAETANSQEKGMLALTLKSWKINFELMRNILGPDSVKEMYQQHWFSVGFDLSWLWIAYYEIMQSVGLPMDNQNISASGLISNFMGLAMMVALVESLSNYLAFGESTNLITMFSMLMLLPIILKSVFSSFQAVQDRIYPESANIVELEEEEQIVELPRPSQSWWGSVRSFFHNPRNTRTLPHGEEFQPPQGLNQ
ncbi:cation-transporting P-type ATPase [Legionella lytica]|uniref:Cation-transporting P-type ATPase n=1 Tax=Legionella lytica TaxID=96232 RepID=A0ABW8D8M5_9GAMM